MAKKKSTKKKLNIFIYVLAVFFIIGGVGGFFTFNYLTKDDKFEIIGDKEITLHVGEEYVEKGAIVISFGKDESAKIEIDDSNLNINEVGNYYIKYTATDYRFKGKVRYRYVEVVEVGEWNS